MSFIEDLLSGTIVGGGSGGPIGGLTGANQAQAALEAAKLQYRASQEAMRQQREMFDLLNAQQAPYRMGGYTALNQINALLGLPPAYTTAGYGGPISQTTQPMAPTARPTYGGMAAPMQATGSPAYGGVPTPQQMMAQKVMGAPAQTAGGREGRIFGASKLLGSRGGGNVGGAIDAIRGATGAGALGGIGLSNIGSVRPGAAMGATLPGQVAQQVGPEPFQQALGYMGAGVLPGGIAGAITGLGDRITGGGGGGGGGGAPAGPGPMAPAAPAPAMVAPGYQTSEGTAFGSFARPFTAADLKTNLAPNYQFMLEQGLGAVRQGANVGGGGSNIQRAATKFAEDYASNAYQNALQNYMAQQQQIFNRLSGVAGIGQTAQGQQLGLGSNLANALSQLGTSGASALGAGQIGAAGAQTGALQNLVNLGALFALA